MWSFLRAVSAWFRPAAPPPVPMITAAPTPPPAAPRPRIAQRRQPPAPPVAAPRLDSIVNSLSALGGVNDKGAAGEVDTSRGPLASEELDVLYKYNAYVRRGVDIVAQDATRRGWYVKDSTRDTDPFAEDDKRLSVQATFRDAIQNARLYGGCGVLMVLDEIPALDASGAPIAPRLDQPVDWSRVRAVRNLIPLDPTECYALIWDGDPRSSNFRRPLIWQISPQSGTINAYTGTQVHWTRILYVPGEPLTPRLRTYNRGMDYSIVQAAWDAVRNLTTVDQAGATHSQELSVPVLKIGDMRAQSAAEQQQSMSIRMSLLARSRSLLNMILIGPEENYEHREVSLGGFDKVAERAKEAVACAFKMPIIVLFGEAPGGLNTDGASHRTLWDRVIAAEQQRVLLPALTRLYRALYRAKTGPTGGEEPAAWAVEFYGLDELGDQGKIDLQKAAADVDKIYLDMGVLTAADIRASRFGSKGWSADILPATAPPESTDAAPGAVPVTPAAPRLPAGDIPIRVQIPAGDIRRGVGADGRPWAVRMPADYGEIPGTRDLDGEPTDVLVLPGGPRGMAFVVEQLLPAEESETEVEVKIEVETDRADAADAIDEHKVILGAAGIPEVMALLQAVYGESGRWGKVYPVPETQLLPWLAAHMSRPASLDAIDMTPPKGVVEELKRGLAWHEEGKSGRGLVPATVAWARRLSRGEAISPKKARLMRAWLARHETDKSGEGYKPGEPGFPSPGRVAWALWGGDDAAAWSNKIVEQLERASRA